MKRTREEMASDNYVMGAAPTSEQTAKWRAMRCDSQLHPFRHQEPGHQEIVGWRRDLTPGKPVRGHGTVCLACAPYHQKFVETRTEEQMIAQALDAATNPVVLIRVA